MSLDIRDILDAVVSHAMSTGSFDSVNEHEPKSSPGLGLTCAVWVDRLEPIRASGLDSTSVRAAFNVRLYTNMLQEPQDLIDTNLMQALDLLMAAYSGDFQLDGLIRNVDLLGSYGAGLSAQAGYIPQDGKLFRVITIQLPLIVNDVWTQVP